MRTRGLLACAVACAFVVAACGGEAANKAGVEEQPEVRVLTLSTPLSDPAELTEFVNTVARLSDGTLRIDVQGKAHLGEVEFEKRVITDVQAGRADLGVVGSRAFDSVGVTAFEPLDAPLLIDSYRLEEQVLTSGVVDPMLDALEPVDLTGLGVIPGPLRRLLGTGGPLRTPDDFRGLDLGVQQSQIASATVEALGGTPHWFAVGAPVDRFDAIESQVASIMGNEYDLPGSSLATNVNLWPRPLVVFAGTSVFASLTAEQQATLRSAAAASFAPQMTRLPSDEQEAADILCSRGRARFDAATPEQLAALRAGVQPVYDAIAAKPGNGDAIATIERLKAGLAAPPDGLETCAGAPAAATAVATAIDGVWRMTSSMDEADEIGDPEPLPENYGRWTAWFDRGRFAFTQEAPEACTWAYGTFQVDGDRVALDYLDGGGITPNNAANKPGEHFAFVWNVYRDTLELSQAPGEISPNGFYIHAWHRLSTTADRTLLSRRCPPPDAAFAE